MPAPTHRRVLPALAAAAALLLAACGSATTVSPVRDPSNDVPFKACGEVACTGSINGAAYEIVLPTKWNGTLLLYSHGYRNAQPAPPDLSPVSTAAEPAPGWSDGAKDVGQALLDQGYALAGSAYASNGWAVEDGVRAGEEVYDFFAANVGTPNRVYLWGDSLGGLITQTLAEKKLPWVSGTANFCGAVAGIVPNMDLALDVAFAIKTLIAPDMKLTGFSSYEESVKTFTDVSQKVIAAAADTAGGGTAKVLYIGALVQAPGKTRTYDGSTIESQVRGTTEAILTALGFGTFGRYDVEQRFGGNISDNTATDYSGRVSAAATALIDRITPGAVADYSGQLAGAARVSADPTAGAAARATGGDPSGAITVPTLSIHTTADPLVIVQNQSFLRARYLEAVAAGTATADFVQLYTSPPATYPQQPGAPYGAGHCNFTTQTRIGMIEMLDRWVRGGLLPGGVAIPEALGTPSGYAPGYVPGPWPNPAVS